MLALVKCCLCAVGVVLGLLVPSKAKKAVLGVSLAVFAVTYIPLMADFLPKAVRSLRDEYALWAAGHEKGRTRLRYGLSVYRFSSLCGPSARWERMIRWISLKSEEGRSPGMVFFTAAVAFP